MIMWQQVSYAFFVCRLLGAAHFLFMEAETMKKVLSLLLALSMLFALCACGGGQAAQSAELPSDEVVIEDVYFEYVPSADTYWLYVKARNMYVDTGDKELPNRFAVLFQLLDENGDVIANHKNPALDRVWLYDLDIGQGGYGRTGSFTKDYVESAVSIRFPAYVMMYNPSHIVWDYQGKFTETQTFPINIVR